MSEAASIAKNEGRSSSGSLHLLVRTPWALTLRDEVVAVTAEDESGRFGLRPGAEAVLSALVPGVLYARKEDGSELWIAVGSGMLRSTRRQVEVCVRQAVVCASLESVQAELGGLSDRLEDGERRSRETFRLLYRRMVLRLSEGWRRR